MKKQKLQPKKILPLLASFALLSGPILLVTACDSTINRYNTSLPNSEKNQILLDFIGVNFNEDAQTVFQGGLSSEVMGQVIKQLEGIMAHQEFFDFFTKKLNYSADNANQAFENIKDTIGLNILANRYFTALNTDSDFDGNVYKSNLIFQTDSWHKSGTNKFDYSKDQFYKDHDPNEIFSPGQLYTHLADDESKTTLKNIIATAKNADNPDNYNNMMSNRTFNNDTTYTNDAGPLPAPLASESTPSKIKDYQLKLERFKWLLRFRYSQYYISQIEPQLNEDLFTMAHILDTILKIDNKANKPNITIQSGVYPGQLQDVAGGYSTKFRYVWDYTTTEAAAEKDQENWNPGSTVAPNLVKDNDLNPDFFNKFTGGNKTLKNTVDPIFGTSGFMEKVENAPYAKAVVPNQEKGSKDQEGWLKNENTGVNYWKKDNKCSFAYGAPIYWMDDILNMNFNWGSDDHTQGNAITIDQKNPNNTQMISDWNKNRSSQSPFSQYLRGTKSLVKDYDYVQTLKWNLFWQMLYSISTQNADTPYTNGKENYPQAGQALYPKYIKKENVYSKELWDIIKSNYPER